MISENDVRHLSKETVVNPMKLVRLFLLILMSLGTDLSNVLGEWERGHICQVKKY